MWSWRQAVLQEKLPQGTQSFYIFIVCDCDCEPDICKYIDVLEAIQAIICSHILQLSNWHGNDVGSQSKEDLFSQVSLTAWREGRRHRCDDVMWVKYNHADVAVLSSLDWSDVWMQYKMSNFYIFPNWSKTLGSKSYFIPQE